jgi:hypothetical protein
MIEDLLRAPLPCRRMPAEHALGRARQLGGQRARWRRRGDPRKRQRSGAAVSFMACSRGYAVTVRVARQLTSRITREAS